MKCWVWMVEEGDLGGGKGVFGGDVIFGAGGRHSKSIGSGRRREGDPGEARGFLVLERQCRVVMLCI
jgi:hypothetical protein